MIQEEHRSPDGVLTLVIEDVGGSDLAAGSAQSPWHMHAAMLAPEWGSPLEEAVRAYADAVLCGEVVIGVRRIGEVIVEVWITEDAAEETDRVGVGETLEMRSWDGQLWQVGLPASSTAAP